MSELIWEECNSGHVTSNGDYGIFAVGGNWWHAYLYTGKSDTKIGGSHHGQWAAKQACQDHHDAALTSFTDAEKDEFRERVIEHNRPNVQDYFPIIPYGGISP